jgi:hypothetical protein
MRNFLGIIALLIVSGCSTSGFSASDKYYFAAPPYISSASGQYSINWQYGRMGCAFFPEAKVVKGELLFSLHATTSSGCSPGRKDSMPINKPAHIQALQSAGAFWQEPDGTKLRLEVRQQ